MKLKNLFKILPILLVACAATATNQTDYIDTVEVHLGPVSSVVLIPELDIMATSGISDMKVKVWTFSDKKLIKEFAEHKKPIRDLIEMKYQNKWYLASCSHDNTIKVYDLSTMSVIHTLYGHSKYIQRLLWIQDTDLILSTGLDNTIRTWNFVKGGDEVSMISNAHKGEYSIRNVIRISSEPDLIVSIANDKNIIIWNYKTGQLVKKLPKKHESDIYSIVYIPKTDEIVTAEWNGLVYRWDWRQEKGQSIFQYEKGSFPITLVNFPNSTLLAMGGYGTKDIYIIDAARYNYDPLYKRIGTTNEIWRATHIPNTGLFLSTGADYSVKTWNICQDDKILFDLVSGICVSKCPENRIESIPQKACLPTNAETKVDL